MLVLDPFMGTGSTALACQKLRVDYIGFEIDKAYVTIKRTFYHKKKNDLFSENSFFFHHAAFNTYGL